MITKPGCVTEQIERNGKQVTIFVPYAWRLGVNDEKKLYLIAMNRDSTVAFTTKSITHFEGDLAIEDEENIYKLVKRFSLRTNWHRWIKFHAPREYNKLLMKGFF